MKLRFLIAALFFASAAHPALANDDMAKYQDDARKVVKEFATRLGGELKKEMEAHGPIAAIGVCRNAAPAIAAEESRKSGWRVTRVSLKVRDPLLGTPDAWEQKVLADFDARLGKKEDASKMEFSEIVTEPQGKYFRYMKAIPVQGLCLKCHGTPENIAPPVKDTLAAEFPHDKATGYEEGQLRGAFSIKRPL